MLPLISTVAALLARPACQQRQQTPSHDSNQTQSNLPVNTTATTATTITTTVTVLETTVARAREIPHTMVCSPQPARVLALATTAPSQISQSNSTPPSQININDSYNDSNNDSNDSNNSNSDRNPNPPEFILAFARRNVPIDRVLAAAGAFNTSYQLLLLLHAINNPPCQHILSMYTIMTLYNPLLQHILSIRLINTSYYHIIITHPSNLLSHTLSTHSQRMPG